MPLLSMPHVAPPVRTSTWRACVYARGTAWSLPTGIWCCKHSNGGSARSRARSRNAMQLWLERTVARWADRDLRWTQTIHRVASWPVVIFALVIASRLANGVLWYTLMVMFPLVGGLT